MLSLLADAGADLDCKDGSGSTCAHFAADHGHLDTIKALHSRGANLDAIDGDGDTVLASATTNGHVAIAE